MLNEVKHPHQVAWDSEPQAQNDNFPIATFLLHIVLTNAFGITRPKVGKVDLADKQGAEPCPQSRAKGHAVDHAAAPQARIAADAANRIWATKSHNTCHAERSEASPPGCMGFFACGSE